jgi:hypothetical protein
VMVWIDDRQLGLEDGFRHGPRLPSVRRAS